MEEKRRSKRFPIDVEIKLDEVKTQKNVDDIPKDIIHVTLVNVSRNGLAFKCTDELKLNTFFDVNIILWTKATFQSVIEIVRMECVEDSEDNEILYGCRFIGLRMEDELKIKIYELLQEQENNIEE